MEKEEDAAGRADGDGALCDRDRSADLVEAAASCEGAPRRARVERLVIAEAGRSSTSVLPGSLLDLVVGR